MSELKLQAHLSYVDSYGRLHFVYRDDVAYPKLRKHCIGGTKLPYTTGGFHVKLPRGEAPQGVEEYIGYTCEIRVRPVRYKFPTGGKIIDGVFLKLLDIKVI